MVKDPLPDLTPEQQVKLGEALIGLLDRTSSSDLLLKQVKIRRTVICLKAISLADIPGATARLRVLSRIVYNEQYRPLHTAEVARLVKSWDTGEDAGIAIISRALVSGVVARAQRRDNLWFTLASNEMSVSESVLRNYATHGNNLSLAILNHVVRQQLSFFGNYLWQFYRFWEVLEAASKFDVHDTSPELQHEFCALWNEVIRADDNGNIPWYILRPIRNIYLTLHLHTDCAPTEFSPSTNDEDAILKEKSIYPMCNIPGHHPNSTPRIHDASTSTVIPRSALHNSATLVPSFPADASSPPVTTPVHVDENLINIQLFDKIPASATLNCAHQIATENVRDSTTSLDRATAGAALEEPSSRTIVPTTREASMVSSIPPPAEVSFHNKVAHSGTPEFLASLEPVLGDTAGSSLSLTLL